MPEDEKPAGPARRPSGGRRNAAALNVRLARCKADGAREAAGLKPAATGVGRSGLRRSGWACHSPYRVGIPAWSAGGRGWAGTAQSMPGWSLVPPIARSRVVVEAGELELDRRRGRRFGLVPSGRAGRRFALGRFGGTHSGQRGGTVRTSPCSHRPARSSARTWEAGGGWRLVTMISFPWWHRRSDASGISTAGRIPGQRNKPSTGHRQLCWHRRDTGRRYRRSSAPAELDPEGLWRFLRGRFQVPGSSPEVCRARSRRR